MKTQCTERLFLEDVSKHQITILRDDGVNRHVKFSQPDSHNMRFDLITWPGYLCYCGDMGTFVFRRLNDMFQFFRTDREHMHLRDGATLAINLSYWGEKLEAIDRSDGFKEYSPEKFKDIINEIVDEYISENEWPVAGVKAMSLRDTVANDVLNDCETEQDAHEAARDFEHDGFEFRDFWERSLKEYTFRFVWCCYAIAWAVQRYDAAKAESAVAA